ncbi:adenosylhomocysteinase [Reinekea marinisedimentorum]|uniref:Adenosylhomocysteinase n=1 Tax=Reinekea marinisedimentorum TaxID=230495 RepID=A0A4R3I6P0_9GAMM|nr:adenosylhomocysteinase [Reinekea marinisedimentorum]TCS41774.1 adenosylhomocysteinase [Reinekea marinisedimentorum]
MDLQKQIDWQFTHMPRTRAAVESLGDCSGKRLAACTHLDQKMITFYEGYLKKGGELFLTTCNPTTVRDEVVEYLVERGAEACAWKDMSDADWKFSFQKALQWKPDYICEFGGDLTTAYHESETSAPLIAGLEGTGSGVSRLQKLSLQYPVFNWDDLAAKEGLHNRHMVGLTTWQAFMERTHLSLHEKKVLVIGAGLVGQGVAASARAFGGTVSIAEIDPSRRLLASYDGWPMVNLEDAIGSADIVVTATGVANVVTAQHLQKLKHGAFVLNVGHVADEINTSELDKDSAIEPVPEVFEYPCANGTFYLLSNGAMFNLTAGYGDSINAFDVSLALMTAGVGHILRAGSNFQPGLHLLPKPAWEPVL